MTERWLPVVGYEGLYEVSDLGRVRSLDREIKQRSRTGKLFVWVKPGRVMDQSCRPESPKRIYRYWRVNLTKDSRQRSFFTHRLVADAFLGPCPSGQMIRHGPGGMRDNSVSNLSYGTASENQADKIRDGTHSHGERNHNAKLTWDAAVAIREAYARGARQGVLAEEYGVSTSTISYVVNGDAWKIEYR